MKTRKKFTRETKISILRELENGNISKPEAKLAESERLIGQLYAENTFLKKVLASLETKLHEHQKQREGN